MRLPERTISDLFKNHRLKDKLIVVNGVIKSLRLDNKTNLLFSESKGPVEAVNYYGVLGSDDDLLKIKGSLELIDSLVFESFYWDSKAVRLAGKLLEEGQVYRDKCKPYVLEVYYAESGDYYVKNSNTILSIDQGFFFTKDD